MRLERMFLPLLIFQNRRFVDKSRASGDDDRLPTLTIMYLHDGVQMGLCRYLKEAANLQNGDCSSLRSDELGWRDCDKTLLVVEETLQELHRGWSRYR